MSTLQVHFEPIGKEAHPSEETEREDGTTVDEWPLESSSEAMPPEPGLVYRPVQSLVLVKEVIVAELKHGHSAEDNAAYQW